MSQKLTTSNSNTTNFVCGNSSLNANYTQKWYDHTEDWKVYTGTTAGITSLGILTINNNNIMQSKVAVFKVTRDENQKITSTKFIKELWIESKNGSSIDFEVAKDPEISKFEANEIVIRNIYSVTF
jgi:hypothetical protein